MPSPIINLLGEIVIQIRDIDQEAHQEYRWYELYDKIFNYIVQISPEKNTLTVSPQWKVQREAFDRMFNFTIMMSTVHLVLILSMINFQVPFVSITRTQIQTRP